VKRAVGQITKVDEDQRLVFGWASIIKDEVGKVLLDRQDDYIDDEAELEKAAYSYVLHSRDGGEMHIRKGVSTMVESIVLTKEKQAALGVPEGSMPVGWWIGFRVNDDRVWNQVKKGEYIGFSVHGTGQRKRQQIAMSDFTEVEKKDGDMTVCKECGAKVRKGEACKRCGAMEKSGDCGCGCGGSVQKGGVAVSKRVLSVMSKAQSAKQGKVSRVMREFEAGTLKTSSGKRVTNRRQAMAIAMSEAGMSKGDCAGHPFRGNQHTGGKPGQGGCGTSGGGKGGKKKPEPGTGAAASAGKIRGGGSGKRSSEIQGLAQAAARGKGSEVRLRTPKEIDEFIKAFHAEVTKMKDAGEEAPVYNLCKITVPGTNLFCEGNKNVARIDMPQVSGKVVAGTDADKLPKNEKGEVDGTEAFKEHMTKAGVGFRSRKKKVKDLQASQNELVGANVAWMANNTVGYDPAAKPIFVSSDGYVLDGHHRWAAVVAKDSADDALGDLSMNVVEIDMPIEELLKFTNDWATEFGIAPKKGS